MELGQLQTLQSQLVYYTKLILVVTSVTASVAHHTSGPVPLISNRELQPQAAVGIQAVVTSGTSIPVRMVSQAPEVPVDRVTANGVTGNTSPVPRTRDLSMNFLGRPMIHQSYRLASTLRTTMTFLWRHRVMMYRILFCNSRTHRSIIISYPTFS